MTPTSQISTIPPSHPTSNAVAIEFIQSRLSSFSTEFKACLGIPIHSRHVALNNLMRSRVLAFINDYHIINADIYPLCSLLIGIVDMYRDEVRTLTEGIESATQLINFYDSICLVDKIIETHDISLASHVRAYFTSRSSALTLEPIQKMIIHYRSMCDGYFKHGITELRDQLILKDALVPEWLPDNIPVELVKYSCLLRVAYACIEAIHNKQILSRLIDDEFTLTMDIPLLNYEAQEESSLLNRAVEGTLMPFIKSLEQ